MPQPFMSKKGNMHYDKEKRSRYDKIYYNAYYLSDYFFGPFALLEKTTNNTSVATASPEPIFEIISERVPILETEDFTHYGYLALSRLDEKCYIIIKQNNDKHKIDIIPHPCNSKWSVASQ